MEKAKPKIKLFNMKKLKDVEVTKKYKQLIQNKLTENPGAHGEKGVGDRRSKITQAIKECATKMVGWTE